MSSSGEHTKLLVWPPPPGPSAIVRGQGLNVSERDLVRLAERSFLSIWSYPNVWRDQRFSGGYGGDGKELCDLLIIFDNHVIIFSDKDVAYKPHDNPKVAWRRWYKAAIKKSADQIYGTERWIRENTSRIFIDKACTQPLPVPMPPIERMKVHRVVVAHGASKACREHLGEGNGSLLLTPSLAGDDHLLPDNAQHFLSIEGISQPLPATPFMVGKIDPNRGYVHVLDDISLYVLLNKIDTVIDFVEYLERKEHFVASGKLATAAGEVDLLAFYLSNLDEDDQYSFNLPIGAPPVTIAAGSWESFQHNPQHLAQIQANRVSYFWDALIERFNFHILNDSQYYRTKSGLAHSELLVRFLARESRTRRRFLSESFLGLIELGRKDPWKVRLAESALPNLPHYIFMVMSKPKEWSDDRYREFRRHTLAQYASILKVARPAALDIIGIAVSPPGYPRSEDLLYLDARTWTVEDHREAEALQRRTGFLTDLIRREMLVETYPDPSRVQTRPKHF